MKRTIAAIACAALILCLLPGCVAGTQIASDIVNGELIEKTEAADGALLLTVQPELGSSVTLLLPRDAQVTPLFGEIGLDAVERGQADAIRISATGCDAPRTETGPDGQKRTVRDADWVLVDGALHRGAATLPDGTALDEWDGDFLRTFYLPDGTRLLDVSAPAGATNSYVSNLPAYAYFGQEGLPWFLDYSDDRPLLQNAGETAIRAIVQYYEDRGVLLDVPGELERAWARYKEQGDRFQAYTVFQDVTCSAACERVLWFCTSLTVPDQELLSCDAFDYETGERLETASLFTCAPEELGRSLLEAAKVRDEELFEDMLAAFSPEHVIFWDRELQLWFPAGALRDYDTPYILGVKYDKLAGLLRDWAVPR